MITIRNNIQIAVIIISTVMLGCSNASTYLIKGKEYIKQKNYDSALVYLTKYLEKEPSSTDALRLKALAETRSGKYDSARFTLTQLKNLVQNDADLLTDYGSVLYKVKLVDSAKFYFDAAYEMDSNAANLNYNLAVMYFNDFAQDSLALLHVDKELRQIPSDFNSLLLKGNILLEQGELEDANSIAEEINKVNDTSSEAYELAGLIWFKLGRYDRAIVNYTNAIKLANSNPKLYMRRATALGVQGKYLEALKDCDESISLDSMYVDGYLTRIAVYVKLNQTDRACLDLNKLNTIAPQNSSMLAFKNLKCN